MPKPSVGQLVISIAFAAFALNFFWEVLHSPLYNFEGMHDYRFPLSVAYPYIVPDTYLAVILTSTAGDVVYVVLIYALIAFFELDLRWVLRPKPRDLVITIGIGLVLATVIEWHAFAHSLWSYTSRMPIVPILNIGWTPALELAVTALGSFWLTKKYIELWEIK